MTSEHAIGVSEPDLSDSSPDLDFSRTWVHIFQNSELQFDDLNLMIRFLAYNTSVNICKFYYCLKSRRNIYCLLRQLRLVELYLGLLYVICVDFE